MRRASADTQERIVSRKKTMVCKDGGRRATDGDTELRGRPRGLNATDVLRSPPTTTFYHLL